MDLYFEPDKGKPFWIEVGYFDTMLEIKEKVQKYQGIPVHQQTVIFNDETLPDDLNIHPTNIFDRSRIKLLINTPTVDPQPPSTSSVTANIVKTEPNPSPSPSSCNSSSHKIKIVLKTFGVVTEMDVNDSVLKLKEKINETEGVPLSRIVVYANGIELHDHKTLHEGQLVDGSEVEIILKPPTPTATATATTTTTTTYPCGLSMNNVIGNNNYSKKLKVNVVSKSGEKIALELNPMSNVGELRKELQKVRNQGVGFRLPEEGYFFIYKQNVMEEDQSFRWHRVAQGDTVEIFNGCVTGGS